MSVCVSTTCSFSHVTWTSSGRTADRLSQYANEVGGAVVNDHVSGDYMCINTNDDRSFDWNLHMYEQIFISDSLKWTDSESSSSSLTESVDIDLCSFPR